MNGLRFIGQMCLIIAAVLVLLIITCLWGKCFGTMIAFIIDSIILAIAGGTILAITKENKE